MKQPPSRPIIFRDFLKNLNAQTGLDDCRIYLEVDGQEKLLYNVTVEYHGFDGGHNNEPKRVILGGGGK